MFEKLDVLMFDNVGKKIKNIIKGLTHFGMILIGIVGIVLEIAAFIQLIIEGDSLYLLMMLLIPLGALVAIGILWLSTLLTYGFGEIVDTAVFLREGEVVQQEQDAVDLVSGGVFDGDDDGESEHDDGAWLCPRCEGDVTYSEKGDVWHCPHCNKIFKVVGKGWTQHLKEV